MRRRLVGGGYKKTRSRLARSTLTPKPVETQQTMLAETYLNQLSSQHALAIAYQANGQTKEAVELLEHVVKVKQTTVLAPHPS
jgi:hypothetical protein